MTPEERDLLLRDLLPRLQYGVKIQTWYGEIITSDLNTFPIGYDEIDIEQLAGMKPYLRSMSSMTEEEDKEYTEVIVKSQDCSFENSESATTMVNDWLLSKGFDVRGLISRGLALEAPENMYNTKTE